MPLIRFLRFPGQIACLGLIGWTLWGCGAAPNPQAQSPAQKLAETLPAPDWLSSVKSIQQITSQDSTNSIQIAGIVKQHIPLVEQWLYQIEDGSGSLWVLTQLPPPTIGTQVTLEAQIQYESVPLGEADVGEHYAVELERLTPSAPKPVIAPDESVSN